MTANARDYILEAEEHWAEFGGSTDTALALTVIASITRGQQLLLTQTNAILKPFNLTLARYEVLLLLVFSRAGALPMGKIASRLRIHPASVTSSIDRLEAQGLLVRNPSPGDRRATLVSLCEEGRTLVTEASAALRESFQIPGLSIKQQRQLVDLLALVRRASDDLPS